MKNIKKTVLGIALAVGLTSAGSVIAETKWSMASGYPENNFFTQNLREFVKEVETESKGELKIDLRPNSELIKIAAIKRAVQSNQIQIGEIRLGVYGNESPIFILDSLPNVASTYEEEWRLTEAQKPFFDKYFGKAGMKVLSYSPWPGQGFYTDFKVDSPEQFKDVKLRVYSPATLRMGQLLGFQATILPFAEIPQAFSTGLISALFTSGQTGTDIQAWDFVSHFTYTGSMHNKNAVIVNKKALSKLDKNLQKIVIEAGERASKRAWKLSEASNRKKLKELAASGLIVSEASDEIQVALTRIGKVMMKEWSENASPEELAVLTTYQNSSK